MKRISKFVSGALSVAMLSATVWGSSAFVGTKPVMAASSPQIAGGDTHSLYVKPNGTVWSWGANGSGQLGNGSVAASRIPLKVAGLSGVAAVEALNDYSIALKQDGTVWHWGSTRGLVPSQITELSDIRKISGKNSFVMALKGDGTVWEYGYSDYGQLGNDSFYRAPWGWTPRKVLNLTGVTDIEAGYNTAYALKANGLLLGWGENDHGELGDGSYVTKGVPEWLMGFSDVRSISAGRNYLIALRNDGTVIATGYNGDSSLGDGTTTTRNWPKQIQSLSRISAIASGEAHNLALREDGTVWA